jgi:hypothetical protein
VKSELPIRDVAALLLCPSSRADGIIMLDLIIETISLRIMVLDRLFKVTISLLIIASGLAVVWLLLTDNTSKSQTSGWLVFVFSIVAIGIEIILWQNIQHVELGRRLANFHQKCVPLALQNLIAEYARGDTRTYSKSGTVPNEIFSSHWAILLFSADAEVRGWVRSNNAKRETKEIYAARSEAAEKALNEQPTQFQFQSEEIVPAKLIPQHYKNCDGSNEPENRNENPEHGYLVGCSREQYEAARDSAFAHLTSRKFAWHCFILDGARYELRHGGQKGAVADAIREIRMELIRVFESDKSPNGADPQKLFEALFYKTERNLELRKHFAS